MNNNVIAIFERLNHKPYVLKGFFIKHEAKWLKTFIINYKIE